MPPATHRHLVAIGVPDSDIPQIATSVSLVTACLETLGYTLELPELANLQPGVDLRKQLSLWARNIPASDIAILYFAGHGGSVEKRHYLGLPNTDWRFPDVDALPSEDLFRALANGTSLTNLLIILDTCYSGQAALDAQAIATSLFGDKPNRVFWLLAASRPKQEAGDGDFAVSFDQLIRAQHAAFVRRYELPALLADLEPKLKPFQQANLSQIGAISGELPDFLPNPRFVAEALEGRPLEDRVFFQNDLQQHWKARAIGSEAIFQSGQWYFTGRTAALRYLISWLSQSNPQGRALAVTGDPGSGKSALLGYLVVASDSEEVQQPALRHFLASMPQGTLPASGSITFALALRGKTLSEAKEALALRFQTKPDDVLTVLTARTADTVLIFDALDESAAPLQIADQLLRPLAGYPSLRVIVGTRRPEIKSLGSLFDPLDLDLPEYRSDSDIAHYVKRLLLAEGESRTTPYRGDNASQADAVAIAVAAQAAGNYLVARTIARTLLERTSILDLAHDRIPASIPEAFDEYLKQLAVRSSLPDSKLRELLAPLAYTYGEGLPLSVWELFTQGGASQVLDLVSAFIAGFQEDGHPVYRLYHQALADALRDPRYDALRQQKMAQALYNSLPQNDWLRADWFTRKYFASYAASGDPDLLENAMLDVRFLTAANTPRLLAAAALVKTPDARRRLNWLRLASDRLLEGDNSHRLSHLSLVARQNGALDLASECDRVDIPRKWRPRWVNWSKSAVPNRVLRGHTWDIRSVALSDGIVVSGSKDRTLRFWNLATGEPIGTPITQSSSVESVAAAHGVALSASGPDISFWDLKSAKPAAAPLTISPNNCTVLALGVGFAACGDNFGNIRLIDLATYQVIGGPRRAFPAAVTAIAISENLIVSGSKSGQLEIWPRDGQPLKIETGLRDITSLAIDRNVIAALSNDRVYRRFDLHTGASLGESIPIEGYVNSFVFSNGMLVCAGGGPDFAIRLVDPLTGKLLRSPLIGHTIFVRCVAVENGIIVSGADDNTLRIWDQNFTEPLGAQHCSFANAAASVAIAEPFVSTAHWNRNLNIWDLETGKCISKSEHLVRVDGVARPPIAASDNCLAFIALDGSLHLMDLATQQDSVLDPSDYRAASLEITGGILLVSAYETPAIRRWTLCPAKPLPPLLLTERPPFALTINQTTLWTISGLSLHRWNLNTGAPLGDPIPGATETAALAITADWVVTGHWSGLLKIWDNSTGALLRTSRPSEVTRLSCLALFQDFAVHGIGESIVVTSLLTLEPLFKIHIGSNVNYIAAYSKGVCLACASGVICLELNL